MIISNYYTVIVDGEEMKFSKFIKSFNDKTFHKRWIDYDYETKNFKVTVDDNTYTLSLPEDPSEEMIKQLMDVVTRYKIYLIKKNVNQKVNETGAFPTDKTEIAYYKEYLEQELHDAKVNLAASGFIASIPVFLAGMSFFFGRDCFGFLNGTVDSSAIRFVADFFGMSFAVAGALVSTPLLFKSGLKENYENYDLAKSKLKALKAHEKSLESHDFFKKFIQEEDLKDNEKVRKYKDQCLEEIRTVYNAVNRLPVEKQGKYRAEITDLLTQFQDRVNALQDKNKGQIVLGEASDVWQVFVELLPELNKIALEVREELKAVEERDSFNDEVENFKRELSAGYTEGYTEGYTDELTGSGVAFRKMG